MSILKSKKDSALDAKAFVAMANSISALLEAHDKIGSEEAVIMSLKKKSSEMKASIASEQAALEKSKEDLKESVAKKADLDAQAATVLKEASDKKDEIMAVAIKERSDFMQETIAMKKAHEEAKKAKHKELQDLQDSILDKKSELDAFQAKIDSSKEALRSLIE